METYRLGSVDGFEGTAEVRDFLFFVLGKIFVEIYKGCCLALLIFLNLTFPHI